MLTTTCTAEAWFARMGFDPHGRPVARAKVTLTTWPVVAWKRFRDSVALIRLAWPVRGWVTMPAAPKWVPTDGRGLREGADRAAPEWVVRYALAELWPGVTFELPPEPMPPTEADPELVELLILSVSEHDGRRMLTSREAAALSQPGNGLRAFGVVPPAPPD